MSIDPPLLVIPPAPSRIPLFCCSSETSEYPPVINLRPEADHPDRCNIVVHVGRVRRVLLRIAADIDELARVRSIEDLEHAQVDGDVRAERRRRPAESPLAFPAHGRRIREALGLTQSKFATWLGVSLGSLQEWEQGRRAPSGACSERRGSPVGV